MKTSSNAARAPSTNASEARRREQGNAADKGSRDSRENRGFVQVYALGWKRLQILMETMPSAARLYALLAQHIDGTGAVVATQEVLAEMMGVSTKTIQRHSIALEKATALVRIPLSGGVYAYALNPEEVWRAYDSQKSHAAFHSKTLVSTRDGSSDLVRRKLQVMLREQRGELPLDEERDASHIAEDAQ